MRQVLDILVWMAMIAVVAAVIYFTPRFAKSVAAMEDRQGQEWRTCEDIVPLDLHTADANP